MHRNRADLAFGLGAAVLALLAIVAWVPNDSATGVIFSQRGRTSIGDAMAPMVGFAVVLLSGVMITLESRKKAPGRSVLPGNLVFIAGLTGIFLVSVLLMRWTGPVLVTLLGPEGAVYRELRDTMPWKVSGFVVGGTYLVAGLMALMERRIGWWQIAIGLLATAGLIAVFDLPFPDLLLPPNGDL
ncbi:hypothetical protein ACFQFQ_25465 [Sulfitobacter porphyrae]|uniref:Tripartite tricarboxylate transporter TctB family protein n=1 Tax=Sulfitobacter porphyrae TaxID=1246864 RepID=A0ABW2BA72_9RHOB|nr:hypothetical protein GCM10007928_48020 [Sulfitobacter porphyrae]